jgi:hypothetical protein
VIDQTAEYYYSRWKSNFASVVCSCHSISDVFQQLTKIGNVPGSSTMVDGERKAKEVLPKIVINERVQFLFLWGAIKYDGKELPKIAANNYHFSSEWEVGVTEVAEKHIDSGESLLVHH